MDYKLQQPSSILKYGSLWSLFINIVQTGFRLVENGFVC